MKMLCKHLGAVHARGDHPDVHHCEAGFGVCTLAEQMQGYTGPMACCATCEKFSGPRHAGEIFDRVTIINLKRRPDRLQQIRDEIKRGWPFMRPRIQRAIDGKRCDAPEGYKQGNYVWGCLQSHRRAVEDALNDGCESLLVLEDDATLCPDFSTKAVAFVEALPDDWEVAFFGGRTEGPQLVKPGVARIRHIDRCHAYAVRGRGLKELYRHWHKWQDDHCDWAIAHWVREFKSYAAVPWLVGQRGGYSDLTWSEKPPEWWDHGPMPKLPDDREGQNLAVYPCVHRGERMEMREAGGNCALEAAPAYRCTAPENPTGEATLWKYCTGQTEPVCARCLLRKVE